MVTDNLLNPNSGHNKDTGLNNGWEIVVCKYGLTCDGGNNLTNWNTVGQTDVTGPDSEGYYSVSIHDRDDYDYFSTESGQLVKVRAHYSGGEWSDRLGSSDDDNSRITTLQSHSPVFDAGETGDNIIGETLIIHVYDYLSGGTAFWTPFTATDSTTPAETLSYQLGGVDKDSFSINSSTGQLSLASNASLDADTKDSYDIYILASDDGNFDSDSTNSDYAANNDSAALVVRVEVRECDGIWCGTVETGASTPGQNTSDPTYYGFGRALSYRAPTTADFGSLLPTPKASLANTDFVVFFLGEHSTQDKVWFQLSPEPNSTQRTSLESYGLKVDVQGGSEITLPLTSQYWVSGSGSLDGRYEWADMGATWNNNSSYDVSIVPYQAQNLDLHWAYVSSFNDQTFFAGT